MYQELQAANKLYRISTFSTWNSADVSPLQLAKCGFLYLGNGNEVVCLSCNTRLGGWKADDNPRERHRRNAPGCPFVKEGVSGNDLLKTSNPEKISLENLGCRPTREYLSTTEREREGRLYCNDSTLQYNRSFIDFDKLRYEMQRLLTFSNWPSSAQANPEALARAGLFYTGPRDRVQCTFCHGFMENWKPTDSPQIEHRKHYPDCEFIRGLDAGNVPAVKDQTYGGGRTRHENYEHLWSGASLSVIQNSATQSAPTRMTEQSSSRSHYVEPREVKARMDTSTVRTILDMGYSKNVVKIAIERRLQTAGDDFPNAESLLEALFQLEEEGKSLKATVAGFDQNSASGVNSSAATASRYNSASLTEPSTVQSFHNVDNQQSEFISLPPERSSIAKSSVAPFQSLILMPSTVGVQSPEIPRAGQNDAEQTDENRALADIRDQEATRYLQENRRLHEARTCKVCLNAEVDTVFLPCGHLVCCNICSQPLRNCPICRTLIRGTVKTFLS